MNSALEKTVRSLAEAGIGEHFAIRYGTLFSYHDFFFGKEQEVSERSCFDMASVTKVFCTTYLALMAMDEGKFSPETPVSEFYLCPEDKKGLQIQHLLLHGIGFGHKSLVQKGVNYGNVAEYILRIPCEFSVGTEVEYSCPAFILLGKILEKIYEKPLDLLFTEKIAFPLGLWDSGFHQRKGPTVNSNPTPEETGLVNDYNCRYLGCVAGNAGLFSNLSDLTVLVKTVLQKGAPLISPETFALATKNYTPAFSESRGLGFLYVDHRYPQTGKLFPEGSIGHCGHTGQSVFIHPETGFFAIILSDMTRAVNDEYALVTDARARLHNAILSDLQCEAEKYVTIHSQF